MFVTLLSVKISGRKWVYVLSVCMYVYLYVFGYVYVCMRRDTMINKTSIHALFSASLQMVSLSFGIWKCVNLFGSQHFQVIIVSILYITAGRHESVSLQ